MVFVACEPAAAFDFFGAVVFGIFVFAVFLGASALETLVGTGFLTAAFLLLLVRTGGVGLFRKSAAAIVTKNS